MWKIAQTHPEGSVIYKAADRFIHKVAELSGGRIHILHYPGDLLGDYGVQQEAVAAGSLEFAYTFPRAQINPKWCVRAAPFMYWNWEQAIEAYKPGGWQIVLFDSIAQETGWKMFGSLPQTSSGVISNDYYDPLDPEGRKIRIMGYDHEMPYWQSLGYNPVTLPFSEIPTALMTGTIDCSSGASHPEFVIFGDCFEYFYNYLDRYAQTLGIMNLELWNSLSTEDQSIIMEAEAYVEDMAWEEHGDNVIRDWGTLLDWQKIVTIDGDGWATCAEKVRAASWPVLEEAIGKEYMDVIRANSEELPWGKTLDELNYGYGVLTTEWLKARQGEVLTGP
jgi:TRAP-type C4-dicarboxylate transport system substrate-binding protein